MAERYRTLSKFYKFYIYLKIHSLRNHIKYFAKQLEKLHLNLRHINYNKVCGWVYYNNNNYNCS